MPKKSLLTLACLCCMLVAHSQFVGQVKTYNYNGTPTYGVKIRTELPYTNGSQMPTIIIEGYNFGAGRTLGVILTYYVFSSVFTNYSASSFGGWAPRILLANENDKVVIFIDSKDYFQRFSIRASASGMTEDVPANYDAWTTEDSPVTGSNVTEVPYINSFSNRVGIGTATPEAPLHIATTIQHQMESWLQRYLAMLITTGRISEVLMLVRSGGVMKDISISKVPAVGAIMPFC